MKNRGQLYLGGALVIIGLLYVAGIIFDFDLGRIFWPLVLIAIGVWFLARPKIIPEGVAGHFRFVGNVRRRGAWKVEDEEFWGFVGDVLLDFMEAEIPVGETVFRNYGFVVPVKVYVPEDVGVAVSSTAFVTDARVLGEKRDSFLAPINISTANYETAEKKIRIEATCFVSEIKVRPV